MKPRALRHLGGFALYVCLIILPIANARAQNENETVGFQTNHLFQGDGSGENIDILNGGLNLAIPIGPRYQVTQHLGYQVTLTYASKVWDDTRWDGQTKLFRRNPMGLGFALWT
jgi:hypothetical protein